MRYKLLLSKDQYDILKSRMKDKISFIEEENELTIIGDICWITFDIEINSGIDLLNLFNAGIIAGSKEMSSINPYNIKSLY
jgi:hypothetical protein